jgi:membrane protease YdiL (CAAX protease family)
MLQLVAPFVVAIPCAIFIYFKTGTFNVDDLMKIIVLPAQVFGQCVTLFYLWKAGYIGKTRSYWSPVSSWFLLLSLLAILCCQWLLSVIMTNLTFIPNGVNNVFVNLLSNPTGILIFIFIRPLTEELVFRGAITQELMKEYPKYVSILISSVFFAVYHVNPVQFISAFLIGCFLAWVYCETRSILPCILMHIVNNSIIVWSCYKYPTYMGIDQIYTGAQHIIITVVAICLFVLAFWLMRKIIVGRQVEKK